jgi:hypothetical protein
MFYLLLLSYLFLTSPTLAVFELLRFLWERGVFSVFLPKFSFFFMMGLPFNNYNLTAILNANLLNSIDANKYKKDQIIDFVKRIC